MGHRWDRKRGRKETKTKSKEHNRNQEKQQNKTGSTKPQETQEGGIPK